MSSHHVVREKQEPALLVLGLHGFDDELLGQLLEWSPTVIVTGATAEIVHAHGIKIDWLIAHDITGIHQENIRLIPAGDDSFTEAALKHLVTHGYSAVNVITDELELKDFLLFAGKIDLVILHRNKKIYPITSGFSKWKPAGEIIEIITNTPHLQTGGLELIDKHLFKTTHDGFFTLQFDQPFVFIAETV